MPQAILASSVSQLEVAAPFILGELLLLVSVIVAPELLDKVTVYFGGPAKNKDPQDAAATKARVVLWAVDAALIPVITLGPVATLFILRHEYKGVFLILYVVAFVASVVSVFVFIRQAKILKYASSGPRLGMYRFSPVVMCGIAFNAVAGCIAAFVIK